MSQLEPTIDIPLAAPPAKVRARNRFHLPGWLVLLLQNRKSCLGLIMVGFFFADVLWLKW